MKCSACGTELGEVVPAIEVAALRAELAQVKKEREHWLANHDQVVRRYRHAREIATGIQAAQQEELDAARAEIARLKRGQA